MSILGLELRRSAAAGAALLALAVGVAALYLIPGRWSEGWMPLVLTSKEYLILLWPLALAAGAWQGRREHRAKVGELFATTPRSRARRMLPVLVAMGAALGLAYLLVLVAGGVRIASTASYFPPDVVVIVLVGVLSLVAAAWLGLGLGRLLPALVTAPVLAVAGVLLVFFTAIMRPWWLGAVLSPVYGSSLWYPFQTIDSGVTGALAIWMGGLALAGVLLLVGGSPRARVAAVLPVLLGLGVATAIVPRDKAALLAPVDPVARELVCTDDAPKVCVTRVHANVLESVTPLAREGLAVLAKLPGAPTEVHEYARAIDEENPAVRDDVVVINVRIDDRGGLALPDVVVLEVVSGLGVGYTGDCPRDPAVERAAAYHLLGREPVSDLELYPEMIWEEPELNAEAVALWQDLQELPPAEALSRVAAVRAAILACQDSTGLLSR
ncbi:hypothetical protein [Melissospora conviva]|uniref:hypothetical protein n=1 Tax=Melissospora conviva TaxID=3388432 RepID=UPI003B7B1107